MSRRARWVIGCVLLVVVVVGGCVALADFALGYSRWKNCWFPPRDPDIEVVASACDGSVMRLYINGVLDAEQAATLNIFAGDSPLTLGVLDPGRPGRGDYFGGVLDEVRVQSIAVSGF